MRPFESAVEFLFGQIEKRFLLPGATLSLSSLLVALSIAILVFAGRRRARGRPVRMRTILRALFPRRILRSRSNEIDVAYFVFNTFAYGLTFGWAILSYQEITNGIVSGLSAVFGAPEPSTLPVWFKRSVITLMLFLAYEFGYWFNHWLSHKVPLLWEFHKVHHSAESLTPLTLFRVHPIYMVVFSNILAVSAAIASGFGHFLFGDTTYQYALSDTNLILVVFIHAYVHLQHSHIWISFPGLLGRLFVSPAHHQVHHSGDPKHFNKNFGSCLAIWDWLFGTLYVPERKREALVFGFPGDPEAHTVKGEFVRPITNAGALLFGRAAELFRRKQPLLTQRAQVDEA